MTAELRVLYPSNYRDPVATLRVIADEIEAGKHGEISELALVVLGDRCEVFAAGTECTPTTTACLLQAGAHRVIGAIAGHGRD